MTIDHYRKHMVISGEFKMSGFIFFQDYDSADAVFPLIGVYQDIRHLIEYHCVTTAGIQHDSCSVVGVKAIGFTIGQTSLTPDGEGIDPAKVKYAVYSSDMHNDWAKFLKVPFDVIDRSGNIVKDGTSKKAVPIR